MSYILIEAMPIEWRTRVPSNAHVITIAHLILVDLTDSSHFAKIQTVRAFRGESAAIAHYQPEEVIGGRKAAWDESGDSIG